MTDGERVKAGEAVRQIRQLLGDLLRTSSESREPVADILRLLETVDAYVHQDMTVITTTKTMTFGREISATYTIEKSGTRKKSWSSVEPMARRSLFDVRDTSTTGSSKSWVRQKSLWTLPRSWRASTKFVPDPAEFLVRVVIRFFVSREPPLVVRDRGRYRPARKAKFSVEAKGGVVCPRQSVQKRRLGRF